jgi:hypothetical protein
MTIQHFEKIEITITSHDYITEWITNVTVEINSQRTPVDTIKRGRSGYTDGSPYITLSGTAAVNSDGTGTSVLKLIETGKSVTVEIPLGGSTISFEGVFLSGGASHAVNANAEITFVIDGPIESDSFHTV